tara:strand:+ start:833 stop:1279 length:447 start_codon:yes stop_codon:yes gene_type:complete
MYHGRLNNHANIERRNVMYTTFTKAGLKTIRASLNKAFREVEEAHGIKLNIGNISYEDTTFRTTLKASIVNEDGTVEDEQRKDFKKFATMFDLNPEWLDKEIVLSGRTFTITGLNRKASKNNIRIQAENGDVHICPSKNLTHYFEKGV